MKIDLTYDYILFSYLILYLLFIWWKYLDGTVVKNPLAHAGDVRAAGLIPVLERFCGIGNGNPLQYSCPENCLDRQPWWAIVHGLQGRGQDWTTEHKHTRTHTDAGIEWMVQEFILFAPFVYKAIAATVEALEYEVV